MSNACRRCKGTGIDPDLPRRFTTGGRDDRACSECLGECLVEKEDLNMDNLPFPTDLKSAKDFLRWAMRKLGQGFHPDTRGDEYAVDGSGENVFDEVSAEFYDQYMDAAFMQFDRAGLRVYEFCMATEEWRNG